MGSDSKKRYGAQGRGELLYFDPEVLVVVTDPSHTLWDERVKLPIDERLVTSIMSVGIIEPIVFRRNGEDDKGQAIAEVVDGRQRVRAARIANQRLREIGADPVRVPAVLRLGGDSDLFGVTITANEIRQNDTPLVRAKKLGRYLAGGRTLEEAAVTFGTTTTTLKTLLALLDCHDAVQKAVEAGKIGITHAKMLSAFPREQQPAELDKLFAKKDEAGEVEVPLNERIEKALGARGKVRLRTQKTKKDIASFKERLQESKSADAPLVMAVLDWVLGNEEALNKFRAIKARADGGEE